MSQNYPEHYVAGAAYVAYYAAMGLPVEWAISNWTILVESRLDLVEMWEATAEAAYTAKQAVLAVEAT
jgi:hypothetical protein